eukprot:symbB.v1.2.005492.t1/scaffold321.1/size229442/5
MSKSTSRPWSFEEACTAAGLEVSVKRWWRRRGRSMDQWLRKVLMRGVGPGCAQLMRWGIPQHVLTSGGHLGQYLSEDPELARRFAEHRSQASFMNYLVLKINECFDIQYCSSLYQSGLVLAPKAMSITPGLPPEAVDAPLAAPLLALPEELTPASITSIGSGPPSSRSPSSGVPVTATKTEPTRSMSGPRMSRLKKVKRAMTLVLNRDSEAPSTSSSLPRPATVTGAESSGGATLRLAELRQLAPVVQRSKVKMQSSFAMWTERRSKEVKEQTQTALKKQSSKKLDVSQQFSIRQAMPLSVTKKETSKIVQDPGELRRIFDSFDKDQSGSIDPEEFLPFLTRILKRPINSMDKSEIWQIWDKIDEDGSGQISFEEFQQWYCQAFRIEKNPDRTSFINTDQVPAHEGIIRSIAKKLDLDFFKVDGLWTRFTSFDIDKSGSLDYQEFTRFIQKELCPNAAEAVPDKVVKKFWIEIDADKSGLISFGEFCAWYMKFLCGGKSPMEQYYAAFGTRASILPKR